MRDRYRTITPAPIPLSQPATIGDALHLDEQHLAECSEERQKECKRRDDERASKDGIFWARIVALEALVMKLETLLNTIVKNASANLKLKIAVATIVVGLIGVATTVGIFVAKYAIVGSISIELDKRLPPARPPGTIELDNRLPPAIPPGSGIRRPSKTKTAALWSPLETASVEEP